MNDILNIFTLPGFIAVAKGNATYAMNRGTFVTKDRITEKRTLMLISSNDHKFVYKNGESEVIMIVQVEDNQVRCTFECPIEINRLWLQLPSSKDEGIYGCGEQFTHFNLKGKNVPIWVSEHHSLKKLLTKAIRTKILGANNNHISDYKHHQTYIAQPTFISSYAWLAHADTSSYCEFDFSKENHTKLHFRSIPKSLLFYQGENIADCLRFLSEKTGKHPKLPKWVFSGAIVASQGGWDKAINLVDQVLENGGKVSAIWSQDWSGQLITKFGTQVFWNWQVDNKLYPQSAERIKELNAKGIRFLGYINTFLKEDTVLYSEAKAKNYLVLTQSAEPYLIKSTTFKAGIVDLTNPLAFDWYKKVIQREMIDLGLSGWMADFGEYLPTDAVIVDSRGAQEMHNVWPDLWARCNYEAIVERKKEHDIFVFNRAGFIHTHAYTHSMWVGDQHVDFSKEYGLPSVIVAMLSLSMIGKGVSHSDIGGYTTIFHMKRSEELFMRWAEMNVFSPVFRTHEGNRPESNVQVNSSQKVLKHFSRMSSLFSKLEPYHQHVLDEYQSKGLPLVRPMLLESSEHEAFDLQYQYMYGDSILVAPVIEESATSVSVWLPKGTWTHLFTKVARQGGWHLIDAPSGQPAVFIKSDTSWSEFLSNLSV
ncbi:MAG: alpha-glucosidase [Erysipelotrichaceae bacterium]|nr:alpha-glucosidase [Erysipelotrichaceae bacterium]